MGATPSHVAKRAGLAYILDKRSRHQGRRCCRLLCHLLCLERHILTLLHHRKNLESEYWGAINILRDLETMLCGEE